MVYLSCVFLSPVRNVFCLAPVPAGSIIMYGALLLFESEFVHIVAISFTSLILTELLMVALTVQTWHWLMIVAELLSLACYIASLVFLHEFIGKNTSTKTLCKVYAKCKI